MMASMQDEFVSKEGDKVNLGSSVVNPKTKMGFNRNRGKTFAQCQEDEDGVNDFREGLSTYGLIHMWNAADIKNALNTCDLVHGCPFVRLGCHPEREHTLYVLHWHVSNYCGHHHNHHDP